jgi:hypothetical protein
MDKSFNQIVLERTAKWAAEHSYAGYKKEASAAKKSAKVKELEAFLVKNGFDGREKAIAELFSIVLDEKVEFNKSSADFDIFTMVVPVANGGDHPIEEPTLVVYQNHGVLKNGNLGSGLNGGKENVRPATEAEINNFFESFDFKKELPKEEKK